MISEIPEFWLGFMVGFILSGIGAAIFFGGSNDRI